MALQEQLQQILQSYAGTVEDTKDKLLGVAFVLVNREGKFHTIWPSDTE